MKVRAGTAAAALAVGQAAAQAAYPSPMTTSGPSTSYTTVTLDECPTRSFSTYLTVTGSVTVTYCPECEGATKPAQPGYTTTYTTVYQSLCSTGLVSATYTVTESCMDVAPTWTPGPSHIPDGFTVTTKHCSACDEGSKSVTITEPCGCEATGGVENPTSTEKPAKATNPVQQISDGQVQAPTPGGDSGGGSSPAKPTGSSECNGQDCGGSANQSPSTGGSTSPSTNGSGNGGSPAPACDGEDCGGSANQSLSIAGPDSSHSASKTARPKATTSGHAGPSDASSSSSSSRPSSTSSITPYQGAAAPPSAAPLSWTLAVVVLGSGALAILL